MRKQLKRDAAREELTRTEEAARTENDFKDVEKWWDRLDSNRERRERYHEISLADDMFDWDIFSRQMYLRDDDFITQICFCTCEMHNLVSNPDISRFIDEATDKQKAVFFPRVLIGCSTAKIAHCHGMTERNVRKLIDLMTLNIRTKFYAVLEKRKEAEKQKR